MRFKQVLTIIFLALPAPLILTNPAIVFAEEIVIDAVVASVDGKPITLQDVSKRLKPPRTITLTEFVADPECRSVLEFLILEKLIHLEAESRKIGVSSSEVEEYINEVAARNNLSREGFEAALVSEGKSLEDYKRLLKLDILKSKLTASYVKSTISVSNQEIDDYLKAHPDLSKSGSKVKLKQIIIRADGKSEEDIIAKLTAIEKELEDGKSFDDAAREHSEGREAQEGGSLGVLAEEDLSREIFDAIFQLKSGEHSKITRTAAGYHIFFLEERLVEDEEQDSTTIREEVRKMIYDQKMQEKMSTFFSHEIYKLHSVDKKV